MVSEGERGKGKEGERGRPSGEKGQERICGLPPELNREIQSGCRISLGPMGLQIHDTSGEDHRLGINCTFSRGETEHTI